MEFMTLSKYTGDPKYIQTCLKVYKTLWKSNPNFALLTNNGFRSGKDTKLNIGAGADSYYEYIIKIYVMTRGKLKSFLKRYLMMTKEIKERILRVSKPNNFTFIGEANGRSIRPMMEHLATFAGGMFAVGSVKENPDAYDDLRIALELADTYYYEYHSQPTGVGPEQVMFNQDQGSGTDFYPYNNEWLMRPESVESIEYAYRFSGLPKYREYAWEIFKSINTSARTENGFTHIFGVDKKEPKNGDIQESFFLAETLKYLYLTFESSDKFSQADYVFNTEAHPIKIWSEEDVEKWKKYVDF
jgi:mannosyl-oligosaccharide alpha-1,2-mannosidase